jgi:hypothetical protein
MMSPRTRLLCSLFLLALPALSSGCDAVAVIASAVTPPPEIKAQYVPKPVMTLVLVDPAPGVADPATVSLDADRVSRSLGKLLVEKKAVPSVVDHDKLTLFRDSQIGEYRKLSVTQIASKLGAEQVIYVELDAVGIAVAQGSDAMKGVAGARVRVVAVPTAQVVFPTGEAMGESVAYDTGIQRLGDKATAASVRAETLQGLSDRIAKLFYTWRAEDMTGTTLR